MVYFLLNAMEAPIFTAQQFTVILPVGLVIIFAVLVFAFGFKSSVEPPSFKHISFIPDEKKKPKKKQIKDKKSQTNGHAIDVPEVKKPEAAKPTKQASKAETPKQKKNVDIEKAPEKKPEVQKSPAKKEKKVTKDSTEGKAKKNAAKLANEKPADFDEGEWEVVSSHKDKKTKKKDDQDILPVYTPEITSKKKSATKKEAIAVAEKLTVLEAKPMEILKIEDILPQTKSASVEAVVPKAVATPVSAPTPVAEPEENAAKKKKQKKTKTSSSEDDPVAPAAAPEPVAVAAPVAAAPAPEPSSESPQVFNELEDTWKEAPQKKSKKKVRKD